MILLSKIFANTAFITPSPSTLMCGLDTGIRPRFNSCLSVYGEIRETRVYIYFPRAAYWIHHTAFTFFHIWSLQNQIFQYSPLDFDSHPPHHEYGFKVKLTRVLNGYHVTVSEYAYALLLMNYSCALLNFLPLFLDMVDPSTNLYPDICIIFRPSNFMR